MNEELTVAIKAKELINYTIQITDNVKYFPKKVRFTLSNRMQNLSLDIYSNIISANEYRGKDRKELQIKILSQIKTLLFLIELSMNKKYINPHQCEVWSKHCLNVKNLTAAWLNKSDN